MSETQESQNIAEQEVALTTNGHQETAVVATHSSSTTVVPSSTPQSNGDDFDNLQKAVNILGRAKTLDENKRYVEALKLYREGVDILLEELIVRQGTDQSRSYLRDKCNDFMNRIDQIKLIIQIEAAGGSVDNKENRSAAPTTSN
jgi:hypothetical protein